MGTKFNKYDLPVPTLRLDCLSSSVLHGFKWIESVQCSTVEIDCIFFFFPKNEYDSQHYRQIERSNINNILFSWCSFLFLNSHVQCSSVFSHECDMGFLPIVITAGWCSQMFTCDKPPVNSILFPFFSVHFFDWQSKRLFLGFIPNDGNRAWISVASKF